MWLILCSQVQVHSLGHGGGAREKAATCKVGRELGLEQACHLYCHLPNTANHKACLDSLGQRGPSSLWGGTAKGMDTAEVRSWGKGRVVIPVTTIMNSSITVTIACILSSISNLQSTWPSYSTPSSFSGCEHVSPTLHPQLNVRDEPFPWEKRETHQFHFLQEETGAQKGQLDLAKVTQLGSEEDQPVSALFLNDRCCTSTASAKLAGLSFAFFPYTEAEPSSLQSIFQDLGCSAPLDPKAACLTPNA